MSKGLEDLARGKKRNKVVAFIKDGDAVLSKQEIAIEKIRRVNNEKHTFIN